MAGATFRQLIVNRDGAVAPTVALSLLGLIVAGGVAFDYARLASMDTELQNAADQAALAAASQLDGKSGACSRASAAAVGMVSNFTLMANDGSQPPIVVTSEASCDATGNIRFWQDKAKTTAADSNANANFVEVIVNSRTAKRTLTPIVAAFVSDSQVSARAFAGLGEAICKVPPLMFCNPAETGPTSDFNVASYIGTGLKLVQGGGGAWAPGNFGFLDHAGGSNGDTGLREDLGWVSPPGECQPETGVDTKPGVNAVDDAINTRFDIYDGNTSCVGSGSCPASINSVKDVVRAADASGGNACKLHSQGWHEVASAGQYLPTDPANYMPDTTTPQAMGHPRDMCHAVPTGTAGACTGPFGDAKWDRDAYFRVNYNGWTHAEWMANTGLGANATRWQVYNWEIANRGTSVGGVTVLGSRIASGSGASADTSYGLPQCSSGQGFGTGTVPSTTAVDRRRFSVAVINCQSAGVSGNSTGVPVIRWVDVFLVEPSIDRARTDKKQLYVEVIGETQTVDTSGAIQTVKKSVPYLIE